MDTTSSRVSSSPRSSATAASRTSASRIIPLPDSEEAAYQHARLRAAVSCDAVYTSCCLLCFLVGLWPAVGSESASSECAIEGTSRPGCNAFAPAAALLMLILLAIQIMLPTIYRAHRHTALAIMVLLMLAGDVCWLRSRAGAPPQSSTCGTDGHGSNGTCDVANEPAASWTGLTDALLIRSGVSLVCMHAAMLQLDFAWRVAVHVLEVAIIIAHTTVPLARMLARPAHLRLLRRLHAVVYGGLIQTLAALAALPLPLPLPLKHAHRANGATTAAELGASDSILLASRPACLPLAAVISAQVALGLVLPLWASFLWERASRSAFVSDLRRRTTHAAAAASLAIHPPRLPPAQPCCCGDPVCPVGMSHSEYTVQGVPAALLQALFLCAHALFFAMLSCLVWFASDLVSGLAFVSSEVCGAAVE